MVEGFMIDSEASAWTTGSVSSAREWSCTRPTIPMDLSRTSLEWAGGIIGKIDLLIEGEGQPIREWAKELDAIPSILATFLPEGSWLALNMETCQAAGSQGVS